MFTDLVIYFDVNFNIISQICCALIGVIKRFDKLKCTVQLRKKLFIRFKGENCSEYLSGFCLCVVLRDDTDVSEEYAPPIFRVEGIRPKLTTN
jgi:hypothetical protein